MAFQKCSDCSDEYPSYLMISDTRCKICYLAQDIVLSFERKEKDMKASIESLQLTVDSVTGRLNEFTLGNNFSGYIDHKVEEDKEVVDFSGFIEPDYTEVHRETTDADCSEIVSCSGEMEELQKITKDIDSWVTQGLTEIRGSEKNQKYTYCHSKDMATRKKENKLSVNNKFSVLEEESGDGELIESCIVGSSIIKKFKGKTRKGKKRNIFCNPGAGMKSIVEHIENGNVDGKTVVIHGGGNDIEKINTEELMGLYKEAIDKVRSKGKLCVVSGILPRFGKSPYWSSRAIGVNNRVQSYCKEKFHDVMFIDNWDRFYNNQRFYARDGVHLNNKGSEILSTIIDEKVQINSNLVARRQQLPAT